MHHHSGKRNTVWKDCNMTSFLCDVCKVTISMRIEIYWHALLAFLTHVKKHSQSCKLNKKQYLSPQWQFDSSYFDVLIQRLCGLKPLHLLFKIQNVGKAFTDKQYFINYFDAFYTSCKATTCLFFLYRQTKEATMAAVVNGTKKEGCLETWENVMVLDTVL